MWTHLKCFGAGFRSASVSMKAVRVQIQEPKGEPTEDVEYLLVDVGLEVIQPLAQLRLQPQHARLRLLQLRALALLLGALLPLLGLLPPALFAGLGLLAPAHALRVPCQGPCVCVCTVHAAWRWPDGLRPPAGSLQGLRAHAGALVVGLCWSCSEWR